MKTICDDCGSEDSKDFFKCSKCEKIICKECNFEVDFVHYCEECEDTIIRQ